MRGVITSARRIRITARIVTLPSNTASRNKSRLATSSAALAEEFFFYSYEKNGKRGAGRLPVFFVYALSFAESAWIERQFRGNAHRMRGVISG
jgi:hypothetical protein